ncbi:hypothetical protein GGE65_004521 [Skermanella aerolata]|uniref:transposase n=1 Tax=Skermanella aerolata TaxID=393310 RepID=UPI003D1E4403
MLDSGSAGGLPVRPRHRHAARPWTHPYDRRTTAKWVDFLGEVEARIDPTVERIYAVVDNLSTHRAPGVLLFSLLHPRWEFVFQPKYAAYLNLIEPWWKVLRSFALTRRAAKQKAAGSKPGPRSSRPLNVPPPTGMSTSILSSGDAGGASAKPAVSVSPLSQ